MRAELDENRSRVEKAAAWPVLSLFSGAGGFDLGFKQAGFKPRLAVDIDPAAVETYRWNEPDTHVALLDIAESTPDDLVKLWISINGDKGPVGIIGGPPCQAFSISNVYQKKGDPRRKLLVNVKHDALNTAIAASPPQSHVVCFTRSAGRAGPQSSFGPLGARLGG